MKCSQIPQSIEGVKKIRGALTQEQIELCSLYFFEGRSYEDIAGYLRIGRRAVERRIARAVEKMKVAGLPAIKRLEGKRREPRTRNIGSGLTRFL